MSDRQLVMSDMMSVCVVYNMRDFNMIRLLVKMVSFFFFFKQKTAYEIGVRLVGSEMCIRDRTTRVSIPYTTTKPRHNCGCQQELAERSLI